MSEDARSLESEVASYILAYLLQKNLKSTAHAFLKECDVLPSKTFIVLPETPLHAVIAEHNARLNAKVLVNTLGSESAWQELWSKLHTTLNQIRCLSEDLNSHHFHPASGKVKAQRVCGGKAGTKYPGQGTVALNVQSSSMSPRKRKLSSCRRITQASPPSSVSTTFAANESNAPSSPTMQHVLDTFLDDAFPGKLADIINQCVSSDLCTDDISSDMSSETLERILHVTLSESMLDGAVPTAQSPSCATSDSPTIEPNPKRPKPEQSPAEIFPSEHDIDNFLDQIHQ